MGVVYKAHEESLNRFVAIKVLGEHLAEDHSYVQRFVREAQSAAKLNHPNIVQIYAIGEDERTALLRDGVRVRHQPAELISRAAARWRPRSAARIILQAAAGLQAAHERGIIHRDIKPANLMIDDRGLVKIADFGLALPMASAAARLTATGMFMGTPGYLSPEQCLDEDVDHRTDIYSLGVTFFEALTGRIPFKADSPLALLRQIVDVEPPDVRDLNPEVDDAAREILRAHDGQGPGPALRRLQGTDQRSAKLSRRHRYPRARDRERDRWHHSGCGPVTTCDTSSGARRDRGGGPTEHVAHGAGGERRRRPRPDAGAPGSAAPAGDLGAHGGSSGSAASSGGLGTHDCGSGSAPGTLSTASRRLGACSTRSGAAGATLEPATPGHRGGPFSATRAALGGSAPGAGGGGAGRDSWSRGGGLEARPV